MKSKKSLLILLSVAFLSLSAVTPLAAASAPADLKAAAAQISAAKPINAALNTMEEFEFGSFTGVVKEITERGSAQDSKLVLIENEAGNQANIIITNKTYILNHAEISVGSTMTAYYNAKAIMLMIYPPQYLAEVVVTGNQASNVKVDLFNKDLVSADNALKLNISPATEVVLQDGKIYDGELTNRKLVVIYGVSTRSIPAQTTPEKVIVLFEKAVPPIYQLTPDDVANMQIVVNNEITKAPAAFRNEKGMVMVPLRAISEALGFALGWDNDTRSIMVGKHVKLTIGIDNYIKNGTDPIQLGAAPALVGGTTFVPLDFFRKVTLLNNAYVFEGQIVINNGEEME